LVVSGAKLLPIGALPLPGKDVAMQLDWSEGSADWFNQNAAFVIAQIDPPRIGA